MRAEPSHRKLANIRLTKRFRGRYTGWWVAISLCNAVLLSVLLFIMYAQVQALYAPVGAGGFEALPPDMKKLAYMFGLLGLVICLGIVGLAVLTAHRIGGPYLAIKRTCKAIRDGNLDARLHFRKHDRLDDVAESFNAMMDQLSTRMERPRLVEEDDEKRPVDQVSA